MQRITQVEKKIKLNGKETKVLVPSRVLSREEFEKRTKPIFREIARNLEKKAG